MNHSPTLSRPVACVYGLTVVICLFLSAITYAQSPTDVGHFDVTMEQPESRLFHITFRCPARHAPTLDLKMPAWTPGYYQLMNYAANISNVRATDVENRPLSCTKTGSNTWHLTTASAKTVLVSYDVRAVRNFVASPYLDLHKGYISPAGVFMYIAGRLQQPVTVTVHPYKNWPDIVATGLDSLPGRHHTFTAPTFDVLYDSPMLMGELEQLPAFTVRGVPHYFVGYNLGQFDRQRFVEDLQKIVAAGADIINDIPYKHYTFLAIGPGGGGIEHLNSTSISFDGTGLNTAKGRFTLYSFLAHEYFHHYNVKRIRPVALGPFDYEHENRTNMLWVSEGLTVYYEYLMLRRAGLLTQDELLQTWQGLINSFENKPGRLFQSATQASYDTWSDGPFGRQGDDAYKTISYYEKGPIIGLLLDLAIRHATQNKRSLDDVMRTLYKTYYQSKKRGFTDDEFRAVCEKTAGVSLDKVFSYASTTAPFDYKTYLTYAGLTLAETEQLQPNGWLGLTVRPSDDSVLVTKVDWESPAWNAGIRSGAWLQTIDGKPADVTAVRALTTGRQPGDSVTVQFTQQGKTSEQTIRFGTKTTRSFTLAPQPDPTALQARISADLMRDKSAGR